MIVTAFQPNAFQNNAFQIDFGDTHDGGHGVPDHIKKRLRYNKYTNTYVLYDEIREKLPNRAARLKRLVDSYVEKPTDTLPKKEEIKFDFLAMNQMAYDIYMQEIERLKIELDILNQKNQRMMEDDMLLFLVAAVN